MNFAFLSLPAHGHVNPSLPLVSELVRRGHAVTYLGTDAFRDAVERTGARFQRYPDLGYDFTRPDPNLVRLGAALAEIGVALLPRLIGPLRSLGLDCVLFDSMAPWGSWAARLLGLPSVSSTPTFAVHPAMNRSPGALLDLARTALGGAGGFRRLRRAGRILRARYGVGGVSFPEILGNRGDLALVYTSRLFQPEAHRFDGSVHFVGPTLPAPAREADPLLRELDRACAGGSPLVYVSLGTVFNDRLDFLRACRDAFAGTEVQVLVAAGHKVRIGDLGALPPNVRVRPFVPQVEVLRRSRLFVTHGGMNGVNEGLALGVPLLLFPQMSEQAMVARRVQALGAGRILGRSSLRPPALRAASLAALEDPRLRERASWIGESLAVAGGAPEAARLVAELASAGRGARRRSRGEPASAIDGPAAP